MAAMRISQGRSTSQIPRYGVSAAGSRRARQECRAKDGHHELKETTLSSRSCQRLSGIREQRIRKEIREEALADNQPTRGEEGGFPVAFRANVMLGPKSRGKRLLKFTVVANDTEF
jgi:hypothetical protein